MKSIQVQIGDVKFPMKVQEEEVDTVITIAEYVNKKVSESRIQLKTMQENMILIHASLSIAEELFELKRKLPEERYIEDRTLERVNMKLETLIEKLNG
jgi:cell division protein ZapA (FtsZ GTPase activity inhibitor)